jgi:protein gp37
MNKTAIAWTDRSWNPIRGCSRVSEGCRNCYAERIAARFSKPGLWGHGFAKMTESGPRWTGRVELVPEKLNEPLRLRKPQRIFVNSTSDLFHEALPDEAIDRVFAVMAMCDGKHSSRAPHTFQVLTKRPERMARYFADPETPWRVYSEVVRVNIGGYRPRILQADESGHRGLDTGQWPLPLANLWLGVSVEDQATADQRVPLLLQTPAAVRFVSYEPSLGAVGFAEALSGNPEQTGTREYVSREMALDAGDPSMEGSLYRDEEWEQTTPRIDWLIVGGESGPGERPCDVAWIRSAVRQCHEAGVACFVKQLGARAVASDPADWVGHPLDVRPTGNGLETKAHLNLKHPKGGDMDEWPEDLRVRNLPLTSPSEAT